MNDAQILPKRTPQHDGPLTSASHPAQDGTGTCAKFAPQKMSKRTPMGLTACLRTRTARRSTASSHPVRLPGRPGDASASAKADLVVYKARIHSPALNVPAPNVPAPDAPADIAPAPPAVCHSPRPLSLHPLTSRPRRGGGLAQTSRQQKMSKRTPGSPQPRRRVLHSIAQRFNAGDAHPPCLPRDRRPCPLLLCPPQNWGPGGSGGL